MLNIKFKNLGNINKAEIELGSLTIFMGKNNSGKTYVNYLLYALLNKKFRLNTALFNKYIKEAKEKGVSYIDLIGFIDENYDKLKTNFIKLFKNNLDRFFSAEEGTFKNFEIDILIDKNRIKKDLIDINFSNELKIGKDKLVCEISKEKNKDILTIVIKEIDLPNDIYLDFINDIMFKILFKELNNNTFLLPAERTGINLFYQELNTYRNSLINNLQKSKINPIEVIQDLMISKYPQPIADYIDFLNNTSSLKKVKSKFAYLNKKLHHDIIKGTYSINRDGSISFNPYKKYFNGDGFRTKIDLHISSSTVKTFFSLEFYLEHLAKEGDYLIIDEPELNLHPDNQRNIARLLAQIVNSGINVIISTHSDYIVREFNNLIMLHNNFTNKEELLKKYNYSNEEILHIDKVKAYLVDDGKVEKMEITKEEGIIANTFDVVVNSLNSSSDDIYYSILENSNE